MAITIIGTRSTAAIPTAATPLVELKRLWTDPWTIEVGVRVLHCTAASAGAEIGSCELVRSYGDVKQPFQAGYGGVTPVDWMDYWVRIRAVTVDGLITIWTGRIGSEVREPYGESAAPAGRQTFVAYEPAMMLENIMVGDSYWWVGSPETKKRLEWAPAMNSRDARNFVVGNMARDVATGEEFYGGVLEWTAFAAVWYLLRNFAYPVGARKTPPDAEPWDGPVWSVTGQTEALFEIGNVIPFGDSESLLSILRRIINPQRGIDFLIRHVDDAAGNTTGFTLHVFALSAVEQNFAGTALPTNPNTIEIQRSTAKAITSVRISRSAEHTVGRVRVIGARLVCVATLFGQDETLFGKWTAADETAYDAGTGDTGDDADTHDAARRADRFRAVYQAFGAPDTWDHGGGLAAAVLILAEGQLTLENASQADPLFQNQVRNTLSWTPFRANFNYSTNPPTDQSDGLDSDLIAPLVWAWDDDAGRYVPVDQVGMSVSAAQGDWGVLVNASPNHLLALNHFPANADTNDDPVYDYEELVATLAFQTDQRLVLTFERTGGARPHDGTMDIVDEAAEFWFALPATVFAIDTDGALKTTPDGQYSILRNDSARLFATMAGAISRYFHPRARADIELNGLIPYSQLLGQVLTVIEEGGENRSVQAPVTAIEYDVSNADEPRTRIRAGYAR